LPETGSGDWRFSLPETGSWQLPETGIGFCFRTDDLTGDLRTDLRASSASLIASSRLLIRRQSSLGSMTNPLAPLVCL
jgi:hypothetical protein